MLKFFFGGLVLTAIFFFTQGLLGADRRRKLGFLGGILSLVLMAFLSPSLWAQLQYNWDYWGGRKPQIASERDAGFSSVRPSSRVDGGELGSPLELNNGEGIDQLVEAISRNENGIITLDVIIHENSVNPLLTSNFYLKNDSSGNETMVRYGLCGKTAEFYCHGLTFTNQPVLRNYFERLSFNAVRITGFFHVGNFSEPTSDINIAATGFDRAFSNIFLRAIEP